MNFYDSGEQDGGLVVVPDSIKIFNDLFDRHPSLKGRGTDFVKVTQVKTKLFRSLSSLAIISPLIIKYSPHPVPQYYKYISIQQHVWQADITKAGLAPIKVCAKAGDMLLWDSRTIHCNSPATTVS